MWHLVSLLGSLEFATNSGTFTLASYCWLNSAGCSTSTFSNWSRVKLNIGGVQPRVWFFFCFVFFIFKRNNATAYDYFWCSSCLFIVTQIRSGRDIESDTQLHSIHFCLRCVWFEYFVGNKQLRSPILCWCLAFSMFSFYLFLSLSPRFFSVVSAFVLELQLFFSLCSVFLNVQCGSALHLRLLIFYR